MQETLSKSVYDIVTDRILKALDEGVVAWRKPFTTGGAPRNANSNRTYNGLNVFILDCSAYDQGFSDHRWVTYKGALKLGGKVRSGETQKGTAVPWWKLMTIDQVDENGKLVEKTFPYMKFYNLFNVEQCEDLHNLPKI